MTYEEALASVLQGVSALDSETVALEESAGRALSAPIVSRIALPPWDNAGMDGYAVRREDVRGAGLRTVSLPVVGTIAAGANPASLPEVRAGTAVRIMTGAPVPGGADAVVRIEDTEENTAGDTQQDSQPNSDHVADRGLRIVVIRNDRDLAGRANIRPRGEDVGEGDTLFDRGTSVSAHHIGVLASVGYATVPVHRRPRVVLLSGGDELVTLERFADVEAGRRIVSSTTYALPALLREGGADVDVRPLVPDTLRETIAAVRDAMDTRPDAIVTTGGVSVGAHDYTRDALLACGATIDFWRARIRPGGPIGRGVLRGAPWLGLPGNPVSTMVTAFLFALPLIRRLGGHARAHHLPVRVRMLDVVQTPSSLSHFLRVVVAPSADGVLEARTAGPQGSNLMRTMAMATALLHVPEIVQATEPGAMYDAYLLPGALWGAAAPGVR